MGDCNLVEAELTRTEGGLGYVCLGDLNLVLAHRGTVRRGPVRLAVRPEGVRIAAAGVLGLAAQVRRVTWLGGSVEIKLDSACGEWLAVLVGTREEYAPGREVSLSLDAACVAMLPA